MKVKQKKPTLSILHKKLWKVFSEYVRLRDADQYGYVSCVTCGVRKHWKEMQAGHFISRRHKSILYDERNVNSQCVGCNMFNQGNAPEYFIFMEKTYGREVIEELLQLKWQTRKFQTYEIQELLESYQAKVSELKKLIMS